MKQIWKFQFVLSMALVGMVTAFASVPAMSASTSSGDVGTPSTDTQPANAATSSSSAGGTASSSAVKKPQAPTPPTVSAVTAPQPVASAKPVEAPINGVTVADLTISNAHASYRNNHIDIFFSIKNAGHADEKLGGAGTTFTAGDIVMVSKDKDGKETETAITEVLPAEKSIDFTADHIWLRMKDVKPEPKASDIVPLTLYFRRSPNAVLRLSLKSDTQSKSLFDWMKP